VYLLPLQQLRDQPIATTKSKPEVCVQCSNVLPPKIFAWECSLLNSAALGWSIRFSKLNFYIKLTCAVIPALVLGKLFDDKIEAVLGDPIPIAIVLIVGGIILLFVDGRFHSPTIVTEEEITIKKAVAIGFWQCLAMMPGTSRSAASIIGGMQQGLTRQAAAEFSFFLAVPTMLAVTVYSLLLKTYEVSQLKGYELLIQSPENIKLFLMGNIIAFIVAILAIKFFIGIIKQYGFRPWGWYRIVMGIFLLVYFSFIK